LERQRRVDAGRTALASLLAILAIVDDRAPAADAAHREHARVLARAVLAVLAGLSLDRALGGLVLARVIGLADVLVGGRLGLLELADPVVGPADVLTGAVIALARRDLL